MICLLVYGGLTHLARLRGHGQGLHSCQFIEMPDILRYKIECSVFYCVMIREYCMYRLLAIDLDGTLLTPIPHKHITPRTYKALRQAADAGMIIVIATGQTLSVLQNVCSELPLSAPQIIENGAIIADIHSGEVLHEQLIPPDLILPALATLRTLGLHRAYHTLHRVYADKDTPRARNWYRPPVLPVIEVEDVASLYPLSCIKVTGIGEES